MKEIKILRKETAWFEERVYVDDNLTQNEILEMYDNNILGELHYSEYVDDSINLLATTNNNDEATLEIYENDKLIYTNKIVNDISFHSDLQEQVFNYFNDRVGFHFNGRTAATIFFNSWKKNEDRYIIDLKKPQGDDTSASISVFIYLTSDKEYGIELKIEMFLWKYQTEEVVFQGWVENIEQLKIIMNAVGL